MDAFDPRRHQCVSLAIVLISQTKGWVSCENEQWKMVPRKRVFQGVKYSNMYFVISGVLRLINFVVAIIVIEFF